MQVIDCEKKKIRRDRSIAWAKANPERIRQINAEHHKRNAEKRRAAYKKWAAENPDKRAASTAKSRERRREILRARSAKWAKDNPGKARAIHQAKRARKAAAIGKHTADDVMQIRSAQRDKCGYCRTNLSGRGHLDHIIALSKGGSNNPNNLQWLCAPCNTRKGSKDPIDFARSMWRLV